MNYIPHTQQEVNEMLKIIGVSHIDELFKDIKSELWPRSFNIPEGKSEFEVSRHILVKGPRCNHRGYPR